jgi:hypothetical protein
MNPVPSGILWTEEALSVDSFQWWDNWGSGVKELHDFAYEATSQTTSIGEAERSWKAYSNIHNPKHNRLGERVSKLINVHYSLRLKSKKRDPAYEDEYLAPLELHLDAIDEEAEDLIVPESPSESEPESDSDN